MVGLIDLGVTRALGAGQEGERHTGNGIDDDLLFRREPPADLGGQR